MGGGVPVHNSSAMLEILGGGQRRVSNAVEGLLGPGSIRERAQAGKDGLSRGILGVATKFPGMKRRIFMPTGGAQDRQSRETLMHEFGHIMDSRESFPLLNEMADATGLKGKDREEYYADTVMEALAYLQGPAAQSPKALSRVVSSAPEDVQTAVRELLAHPLYADHPLNKTGLLTSEGE